jgi:hypothetical protein
MRGITLTPQAEKCLTENRLCIAEVSFFKPHKGEGLSTKLGGEKTMVVVVAIQDKEEESSPATTLVILAH